MEQKIESTSLVECKNRGYEKTHDCVTNMLLIIIEKSVISVCIIVFCALFPFLLFILFLLHLQILRKPHDLYTLWNDIAIKLLPHMYVSTREHVRLDLFEKEKVNKYINYKTIINPCMTLIYLTIE